jgi:hypothetical protein
MLMQRAFRDAHAADAPYARLWEADVEEILRQPCRTNGEPSSEGLDLNDSRTALGSLRLA